MPVLVDQYHGGLQGVQGLLRGCGTRIRCRSSSETRTTIALMEEREREKERETGRYPGKGWKRRKEDRTSVELLIRV